MLKLISVQLTEELIAKLKAMSRERSLTMSALIRTILLDYVNQHEEK